MLRKTLPLTVGLLALAQFAYAAENSSVQNNPGPATAAPSPSPNNWSFGSQPHFTDDFESYAPGEICGMRGWEGWQGMFGVCGSATTEQANSGTKSLKIVGNIAPGDNTVHRFNNMGKDIWAFEVMTFVPNDSTGNFYIALLNQYPAPLNWSLDVQFNSDTNIVHVAFSNEETALIKGRWVEFRAEIDMPNDSVDYFYDGVQFVFGKSWRDGVSGGGLPRIAALELYANEPPAGTSGVYFDDLVLALGYPRDDPCDCNCDGTVNAFDIEPFIDILLGGPRCQAFSGDINGDGVVNAFDIELFINYCLIGP